MVRKLSMAFFKQATILHTSLSKICTRQVIPVKLFYRSFLSKTYQQL